MSFCFLQIRAFLKVALGDGEEDEIKPPGKVLYAVWLEHRAEQESDGRRSWRGRWGRPWRVLYPGDVVLACGFSSFVLQSEICHQLIIWP